jgi:hypothetical protein
LVLVPRAGRADEYFRAIRKASLREAAAADPELASHCGAEALGLGCIRGVRYAVAIEALGAFMLYGLWQLWHFVR